MAKVRKICKKHKKRKNLGFVKKLGLCCIDFNGIFVSRGVFSLNCIYITTKNGVPYDV